ncbi:hypothetical protein QBC43DRAFT_334230 [Cladorrhinum sp. PSN259]|nr:hypothetical protein QBC43DRAFT_334230 [Cladorrhinum sp. PSN259]
MVKFGHQVSRARHECMGVRANLGWQEATGVWVNKVGNHPLYPCKLPHPYAVLAYFRITDMWKEKQIPKGANKDFKLASMALRGDGLRVRDLPRSFAEDMRL